MFTVRPQYLLYFIRGMLSTMQQTGCDLQIWFDYRLIFAKRFFFRFISTCAICKEERRRGFLLEKSFTTDGGNFAVCTNIRVVSLKNCEKLFLMNAVFVL